MIGGLLALLGATLVLLSAIGVIRFDDVLARLHALAKASTLGILLILAGAAVDLPHLNDITSVALAGVVHLLASPPASNMVSRAVYLAQGLPRGAIDERGRGEGPTEPGRWNSSVGCCVGALTSGPWVDVDLTVPAG